jgi:hypothetical protein
VPIFNFALRPLPDLQPSPSRNGPRLDWRALSDGWLWLALGGQEIWRCEGEPTEGELPYLDEQVARLWEELLSMLPAVLLPIPEELARQLEPRQWRGLLERAAALEDESGRVAAALGFFWERRLSCTSLTGAPRVHLWRRGETIHCAFWTPPGESGFARVEGEVAIPLTHFLLEVRAFDTALLTLMGERIEAAIQIGGVPGARLDRRSLSQEQAQRREALDAALEARPAALDLAALRWLLQRLLPQ